MAWRHLVPALALSLALTVARAMAADNFQAEFQVGPIKSTGKPSLGSFAQVTLRYRDVITGRIVSDVDPAVWLRRLEADRPPCRAAARSFRITRALSRFDVPLFGAWLGVSGRDRTLSLIDPKIDFQGSNLVSIASLGGALLHLEQDRQSLSLLLSAEGSPAQKLALPDLGSRTALSPEPWAGFMRLANGGWIASAQSSGELVRLSADGLRRDVLAQGTSRWRLTRIADTRRFSASIVAVDATGAAVWLNLANGDEIQRFTLPAAKAASASLAASPGTLVAISGSGASLTIRYRDTPESAHDVPLGFTPEGIGIAPDGSYALAWSNAAGKAELVDLAFGKPVQGFAFGRAGIASVAFTGSSIFIGHASGMQISIIDLAPRKTGGEALLRGYSLGSVTQSGTVQMRPFGDTGEAIAFELSSNLLFMLSGETGHPSPIMGTIPLKGTTAEDVFVIDRGLVRLPDGTFSGVVQLPEQGPLELVATTGTGGTTSCYAIEVEGPAASQATNQPVLELAASGTISSGTPVVLRFLLRNLPAGQPAPPSLHATVVALSGTYARSVELIRQQDGSFSTTFRFPAKGIYPIVIDQGSALVTVNPVVIEVMR